MRRSLGIRTLGIRTLRVVPPPRAAIALLALLGLAAPAPARAQTGFLFGFGPATVSATSVDASLSGSLTVSFHGDPGTGCAARGLCAYSGTVVWRPVEGGGGTLVIERLRTHRHAAYVAQLALGGGTGSAPEVSASVRRSVPRQAAGTCADASQADSSSMLAVHGGAITLRILGPGSSVLATRCAGPLDTDIAAVLPAPAMPVDVALHGHRRVDLGASASFAAGGLAGTVASTLVLHLGSVQSNGTGVGPRSGSKGPRERIVSEPLTLVTTSGAVTAQLAGAANPDVCGGLDSCGLQGTLRLQPQPVAAQGALTAFGPARRPYRDFLAALGLSRRGRAAGIAVAGEIGWDAGGTVAADLTQAGQCQDTGVLGPGGLLLDIRRRRIDARYQVGGFPRTRCPAPALGQGASPFAPGPSASGLLASGAIARRELARRQFSLVLRAARSFTDDGYLGRLDGSLALTLRRGRVTQQVVTQTAG